MATSENLGRRGNRLCIVMDGGQSFEPLVEQLSTAMPAASSFLSRTTTDAEGSAGAESMQPSEKGASSSMASPGSLEKAAAPVTEQFSAPGRPRRRAGEANNKRRENGTMQPISIQTSPLHMAAIDGDVRRVKNQLALGADVNLLALCPAGKDGNVGALKSLCSPLMLAVSCCNPEVVRILLKNGADVSATHANGETIMNRGIRSGNFEIAKLLLDADPSRIDTPDRNGQAPLFMAAGGGYERIVGILIAAGAMVDRVDCEGVTALNIAAMLGHVKCVHLLLRAGSDVSKVDKKGFDALYASAYGGSVDLVELFLNCDAALDINKVYTITEDTLLIRASISVHLKLVKFLLRRGADPFVTKAGGVLTAFNLAEDLAVFKALLEGYPRAAAFVDTGGDTLFHQLVKLKRSGSFMCLLYKAGLDPRIKNDLGLTAADVARQRGQVETAKLLDLFEAKFRGAQSVESMPVAASEGVVEAVEKWKTSIVLSGTVVGQSVASVSSSTEEMKVSVEASQDAAKVKRRHRKVQPCLHCHMSTHRRCARCRTAYICSHDCQVATLTVHRPTCMEIYEKRQAKQAARIEK